MSNLGDIRDRIQSVGKLQKITYAVQLVTGLKLQKLKAKLQHLNRFRNTLSQVLVHISQQMNCDSMRTKQYNIDLIDHNKFKYDDNILLGRPGGKNHLIVVISSDTGLNGDFNIKICQSLQLLVTKLQAQGHNIQIICMGNVAQRLINQKPLLKNLLSKLTFTDCESSASFTDDHRAHKNQNNNSLDDFNADIGQYNQVNQLSDNLQQWYNRKEFDMCSILYTHHISTMVKEVHALMIVPCMFTMLTDDSGNNTLCQSYTQDSNKIIHEQKSDISSIMKVIDTGYFAAQDQKQKCENCDFYYEPNLRFVLSHLAAQHLNYWLRLSCLDSEMADQTARLLAMDRANNNAQDIIKSDKLLYNKIRQQNVTRELIEIISAVELMHAQQEVR